MPRGLKRFFETGGLHFITWSCYERRPLLGSPDRRDLLVKVLEQMRNRYRFGVVGYVVMPEHVHLLMSEPLVGDVASVICAVKLGFARRVNPHLRQNRPEVGHSPQHIWTRRSYDFNVWSARKEVEKLRYMHRNPVTRALVERPEDWKWSSFRDYAGIQTGLVRINDWSWVEEKMRPYAS